jgi:hypothetical protein
MLAMVTAAQNKSDISSQSQAILLLRMKMTWTILLSLRMKMATFLQKKNSHGILCPRKNPKIQES